MTPDPLAGEIARLGRVPAPAPGVLEAARERLWAVVAEEMLAWRGETDARRADPGPRRAAPRQADRPDPRRAGDPDA